MPSISLRDKCKINTNFDTDVFVGVRYIDGDITISFPLGYHLGESEEELRDDIFLLLNTLEKNTDRRDSVLGKEQSQATSGGALLSEFDTHTLQSKKIPGLFCTGEALDCVGDCGGYNLHWAWTTAYIAAKGCTEV